MGGFGNSIGLSDQLVGQSEQMRLLREHISRAAVCDVTVLLEGESGVGKELISRLIHHESNRADGPFVGVNCAAIHETLLESELFGHEAGSFTGADKASVGFLRAAEDGTVLLDEVGDMSPALQTKLLRVLEERAVVPVGATTPIPIDARVIAATNRDLEKAIADGSFREDLYYRLNVVRLRIPSLREHPEDIPLLTEHQAIKMAELLAMPAKPISSDAMDVMVQYNWPGNVRQLGNVIQRAYVLGRNETVQPEDLPEEILQYEPELSELEEFASLQQAIGKHVVEALQRAGGVKTKAARLLHIDRKSLWRMMRRYNIA